MNETTAAAGSAGTQLRKARESQRLPIEALAAAIKVPPQKLKLLEADRFGELPDPAFARALAQTVCRYLKIEPGPVLALLPPAVPNRMTNLTEGLNEPFREHVVPGFNWRSAARPAVWAPLLLLLAAAWLYLAPPELLSRLTAPLRMAAPASSESGAPGAAAADTTIVSEVLRAPAGGAAATSTPITAPVQPAFPTPADAAPPGAAAAKAGAPAAAGNALQIDTTGESWVEVVDADGRSLIARNVPAGESLRLEGTPPLRVKIGNAGSVALRHRGELVDLAPSTRGSVARLRLD